MQDFQYSDKELLQAFMKTAQYLASLTTHEDVWHHIAELMVKFYGANSTGFATRLPNAEIEFHHVITCGQPCDFLASEQARDIINEVLETGFLALRAPVSDMNHCSVVFLPITLGNETASVMIVGHAAAAPISNDMLNVYLAISGLAGTTITRLTSETELKQHRSHLEGLISERTSELTRTLDRLELEIREHRLAEEELRTIRDHLEELVDMRTAELENANIELRTYSKKLERINQELQEFAFVASHDLQEPLRKIQTYCDLTMKRCATGLDAAGRESLERVINSASRMRQLLRDLLAFSSVASRPEQFKQLDLSRVAMEAADVFEAPLKDSGCWIEIEELPAIEADENQMLQLFQNLIGNSLKYRGNDMPHIRVHGISDGQTCEISVEDNGMGFDPQYAELIFKPFQRLHGRGKYDGTGMGLTICRKIVERHGGTIGAESEPGKGSKFIIRLPAKQARLAEKDSALPGTDTRNAFR